MKAQHSQLRLLTGGRDLLVWEGPLRGFSKQYTVRIFWHRFPPDDSLRLKTSSPRVIVIDPAPQSLDGMAVPHIYRNSARVGERICCWDPSSDDWNWEDAIADTVVPYAEQWLCSYEIWRATGIWSAPGRHPEIITCENPAQSTETSSHAQPAPITAAGFVKVGRLIGTFASSALMAVASEGFYRWPRSRDWKGIGFKGVRSPHVSIWLLAPQPAALSPSVSLAA